MGYNEEEEQRREFREEAAKRGFSPGESRENLIRGRDVVSKSEYNQLADDLAARQIAHAIGRAPGHPRFLALLDAMRELHIRKDKDYAGEGRPFENFRSAVEIGVRNSAGAFIRLQDKFKRVQNLLKRESKGIGAAVQDESIEDTLMDLASYALIVLVLREEEK